MLLVEDVDNKEFLAQCHLNLMTLLRMRCFLILFEIV